MTYGISHLPSGNIPYANGYRFGAYEKDEQGNVKIVDFFKNREEINAYVAKNPQYRKKTEKTV